ncbi:hypothetical protein B0H12DRAFT_1215982 [Mycena haematopus]|nr:hypothetical protein B0H12DRAFT_1215982 [Mycena haematopus]
MGRRSEHKIGVREQTRRSRAPNATKVVVPQKGLICCHSAVTRHFTAFASYSSASNLCNHMEQNIVKAIHCPKTISQMIVFVLFCMSTMHPYALQVRGPGTEMLNMLDLGPLHNSVKLHIRKLIEHPNILLSTSSDAYKLATLDGKPWSDEKAWAACVRLAPTHPDIVPLMVAGLKDALECFERFTAEFAVGGRVDLATATERLAAHAEYRRKGWDWDSPHGASPILMRSKWDSSPILMQSPIFETTTKEWDSPDNLDNLFAIY